MGTTGMKCDDFRLMVTGSREWTNRDLMRTALFTVYQEHPAAVLIHGGAAGADTMAHQLWTSSTSESPEVFDADWDGPCDPGFCRPGHRKPRRFGPGTWCPAAGNRRNRRMLATGPGLVLAFFAPLAANKGTTDAATAALDASIPVQAYGDVPGWVRHAITRQAGVSGGR
jgi:hypothetical protein